MAVSIQRGGRQELAGTKEGVHRPLPIGRDFSIRHRAVGGSPHARRQNRSLRRDVVTEHFAQLVIGNLADERTFGAQCGEHRFQRVCGRTGDFRPIAHAPMCIGVDQGHAEAEFFISVPDKAITSTMALPIAMTRHI
jgi:hypothetical protein